MTAQAESAAGRPDGSAHPPRRRSALLQMPARLDTAPERRTALPHIIGAHRARNDAPRRTIERDARVGTGISIGVGRAYGVIADLASADRRAAASSPVTSAPLARVVGREDGVPVGGRCRRGHAAHAARRHLCAQWRDQVIGTDATGLKVLDPTSAEHIEHGTIWCYVGDVTDVVYTYAQTGEGATGTSWPCI